MAQPTEGSKLFSGVQSIADRIDMLQRVRNITNALKVCETSFANTERSDALIVRKVQLFERITPELQLTEVRQSRNQDFSDTVPIQADISYGGPFKTFEPGDLIL